MPIISQPVTHEVIGYVQLHLTTVAMTFNQGVCRNMGVEDPGRSVGIICFGLPFWFFCVNLSRLSG